MSTSLSNAAPQLNKSMKILLPETNGCTYADYPMTGNKWLTGKDKAPEGGYCFIKTDDQMPGATGFKTGYVWGSGPFGFGYYHLLTKQAHITLYHRINNRKVFTGASKGGGGCGGSICRCFFGSGSSPDPDAIPTRLPDIPADHMEELRRLFHARSVATAANDAQAQADLLAEATTLAQGHYIYNQAF